LSALFGHKGPTGILAILKKKGWSSKLSAGNKFEARGIELFDVDVDLTEEGVEHVDDVVKLIFQVIIIYLISPKKKKYIIYFLHVFRCVVCKYVKT